MKYNNVIIWQVTWNTLGRCFSATVTGKSFTPWWQVYPRRPPQRDVNPGWWTWFRCVSVKWLDRICGGPGGVNGRGGRADCKCSHLETLIWNKYGGVNSVVVMRGGWPLWSGLLGRGAELIVCLCTCELFQVSRVEQTDRHLHRGESHDFRTEDKPQRYPFKHHTSVILTHCLCCYSYSPLEALLGRFNKKK